MYTVSSVTVSYLHIKYNGPGINAKPEALYRPVTINSPQLLSTPKSLAVFNRAFSLTNPFPSNDKTTTGQTSVSKISTKTKQRKYSCNFRAVGDC
jgi:hypothetical protein